MRELRWFFHRWVGRIYPLQWNHRVNWHTLRCACGWEMPRDVYGE